MGFSLGGALQGALGGFVSGGGALGAIGGGLLGGFAGGEAEAQRAAAAGAATRGEQARIDELKRQFGATEQYLQPFLQGGVQGQSRIFDLLQGGTDPLLQSQQDLATKAALRRGSAAGNLGTGAFVKDLTRGLADVTNQRINQLLSLRSGGIAAGQALGGFGQNLASNVGKGLINIGETKAGLNLGRANSIDQLLNQAAYAAPFLFNQSPNLANNQTPASTPAPTLYPQPQNQFFRQSPYPNVGLNIPSVNTGLGLNFNPTGGF